MCERLGLKGWGRGKSLVSEGAGVGRRSGAVREREHGVGDNVNVEVL